MREHEVPTHLQAEDKVLLWLTFPQIVMVVAVAAVGYGIYSYAPGPSGLRIGLAVAVGLTGGIAVMGRIGGRSILLAASDLLKYFLGSRRFTGEVSELVRPEPLMDGDGSPGFVERMREKGKRRFRRLSRPRDRKDGRRPKQNETDGDRPRSRRRPYIGRLQVALSRMRGLFGVSLLAVMTVLPQAAIAQSDGFDFPEPIEGRRLYVEGVTVSGDFADVRVRAATDLELRVRGFGGDDGSSFRYATHTDLKEGDVGTFTIPLDGTRPSVTLSWVDPTTQAGAVTLSGSQIPYPLPSVDGVLCDAELMSLGWSSGSVTGRVRTDCERSVMETLELEMIAAADSVEVMAVREADVTGVTGNIDVSVGSEGGSVPFAQDRGTSFSVPADLGDGLQDVKIAIEMRGMLRVPVPPVVELTLVPQRRESQTHAVSVFRPGFSERISETFAIFCDDGTEEEHRISTYLSIPSATVDTSAVVPVVYPEYVKAEVVERHPHLRAREETLSMESGIWADAPFAVLELPTLEPEPDGPTQTRADGSFLQRLLDLFGWEWPW